MIIWLLDIAMIILAAINIILTSTLLSVRFNICVTKLNTPLQLHLTGHILVYGWHAEYECMPANQVINYGIKKMLYDCSLMNICIGITRNSAAIFSLQDYSLGQVIGIWTHLAFPTPQLFRTPVTIGRNGKSRLIWPTVYRRVTKYTWILF